jgi:hypothetical protein
MVWLMMELGLSTMQLGRTRGEVIVRPQGHLGDVELANAGNPNPGKTGRARPSRSRTEPKPK